MRAAEEKLKAEGERVGAVHPELIVVASVHSSAAGALAARARSI